MTFGSYTGITFDQAWELYPHDFFWGIQIKKPGDQLENYLSYVREEYDIDFDNKALRKKGTDLVIQREISEAYVLPKSKARANTRVLKYPVAAAPCLEGCVSFSKLGSKATHIRKTCTVCGHSTSERRP